VAAVVWVGGMFFVVMVLRPALSSLQPPVALGILRRVMGRFFLWVWVSVVALLITGYGAVFYAYGGFDSVGIPIHIMQDTGLTMAALFVYLWTVPWRGFRRAFDAGDMGKAAKALNPIRLIIDINMSLGLFTAAIGATNGFWSY
jgi:uncharacterized membrane protein